MAEGYIICRGLKQLESWKADMLVKYDWASITAGTGIIFRDGSQYVCYAEGTPN